MFCSHIITLLCHKILLIFRIKIYRKLTGFLIKRWGRGVAPRSPGRTDTTFETHMPNMALAAYYMNWDHTKIHQKYTPTLVLYIYTSI